MLDVLNITMPVFGLTALGYGLARLQILSSGDISGFGRFVMMIGMPAILFRAASDPAILDQIHSGYIVAYALVLGLTGIIAWLVFIKKTASVRALATLGAMAPNSGFIGYAIIALALPGMADLVLAMNTLVEMALILPVGLALLEASKSDAPDRMDLVRHIARVLLTRPLTLALPLGLAISLSGLAVPVAASRAIDLLALTTPALAMIFLGGTLAGLTVAGRSADTGLIVLFRLCLAPALAVGFGALVLGNLSPDLRTALVLSAAMPMIGIYPILAADVHETALGARTLLAATVIGFFTLSALLAAF